MAGAVLIIQEAGGTYTKMDGSDFDLERGEILATNGTIHELLMERIKNGGEE
jgi:myo-inositol-1(or 4)-monophosphatase